MRRVILTIILCVLLIFFGCSCEKTDNKCTSYSDESSSELKTKANYLIEVNKENLVSIELPTNYEFNAKQKMFIKDFVLLKINEICGITFELKASKTAIEDNIQNYSEYYINIVSKTSYVSDDLISIIFSGILNQKKAAHPMHIFFALNFDPNTMAVVDFGSRHIINDALYNEFVQQAEKQILEECDGKWPEGWNSFSEELCSKEVFIDGLKNKKMVLQ